MLAHTPIRYSPDVERIEPDEAETIAALNEAFREILDTTSRDYGRAVRSVHAKAHGIARGKLTIHEGLPTELAQGIFASPVAVPAAPASSVKLAPAPGSRKAATLPFSAW